MDEEIRHIVKCIEPGLFCCQHRLVSSIPDDNVAKCQVWCMKWRVNRYKDRVWHHCEKEYQT